LIISLLKVFEKDLIAVLLVVESVHDKNKLLYKYEQIDPDKRRRNNVFFFSINILKFNSNFFTDESNSFHSDYAIVIAKDFEPPR
jgi:hypothetical protein